MIPAGGTTLVATLLDMRYVQGKRNARAILFALVAMVAHSATAVFRKNRRCVHDLAASTSVVKV
jgi:uncharacterized RDD family membrane protein YckC